MLLRGAVIVGRVLDEGGEPLGGVQVMAMQRPPALPGGPPMRGNFLIPGRSSAQTNDLSEFRLFGLKPGEYYVQATARFESGGSPLGMTLLPTYFPDISDLGAAQPISLGAGQTSGIIDIRMIAVPAFQVSGVVLDEARRPVANAMVRWRVPAKSSSLTTKRHVAAVCLRVWTRIPSAIRLGAALQRIRARLVAQDAQRDVAMAVIRRRWRVTGKRQTESGNRQQCSRADQHVKVTCWWATRS